MYSKIKYSAKGGFQHKLKQMSIDELLTLSGSLQRELRELNEQIQLVTEAITAARIERVKQRMEIKPISHTQSDVQSG